MARIPIAFGRPQGGEPKEEFAGPLPQPQDADELDFDTEIACSQNQPQRQHPASVPAHNAHVPRLEAAPRTDPESNPAADTTSTTRLTPTPTPDGEIRKEAQLRTLTPPRWSRA